MQDAVYQLNSNNERYFQYKNLKLKLNCILQTCKSFCGICLDTDKDFVQITDHFEIAHWEGTFWIPFHNILRTVFGEKSRNIFTSQQVCTDCSKSTLGAYLFIYNATRSADILQDYIQQLQVSVDEISNTLFETSDTKQYDNTVIALNNPANNYDVKNELPSVLGQNDYSIKEVKEDNTTKHQNLLICDYCKKPFSRKGLICHIHRMHKKLKCPKNPGRSNLYCPECKESECKHLKYLQALNETRLAGLKTVTCPEVDCNYTCYLKSDLTMHANNKHLNIFTSVCEFCGKPLQSIKQYKNHILKYHADVYTCVYCDRQYTVEKNMIDHSRKCQSDERPYKCDLCPASFITKKKLGFHKLKHESQFPCDKCSRVFGAQTLLDHHKKCHEITEKPIKTIYEFNCFICHAKFYSQKERNAHMKTHDSNEKYKCLVCNTKHENLLEYRNHQKSHEHLTKVHPEKRQKHRCKDCDYSTITPDLLEAHENRYHLKVTPYACQKCPRKFLNIPRLEKHMQKHEAESKYVCELCGNRFRSALALQMHTRRHTGEKPFKCQSCDERFVSASMRSVHVLRAHSGKNFKCPICKYRTHMLGLLRTHITKVHWKRKGEKFDMRKVEGLKEEDYELFRDRRLINL